MAGWRSRFAAKTRFEAEFGPGASAKVEGPVPRSRPSPRWFPIHPRPATHPCSSDITDKILELKRAHTESGVRGTQAPVWGGGFCCRNAPNRLEREAERATGGRPRTASEGAQQPTLGRRLKNRLDRGLRLISPRFSTPIGDVRTAPGCPGAVSQARSPPTWRP